MSVNVKSSLNRVFQEMRPDLQGAFEGAPRLWPELATEVPSKSRSSLYAWLANQASVREWLGPRIAKEMGTRSWEVLNRKWELTFQFDRDQVEDDLDGLVASAVMQARGMGMQFAAHEDSLVAATLEAGISSECHDGQYFFDTDHPIDPDGITSGTFDNDRALALSHANYRTCRAALMSNKKEDGTPVVMPTDLKLVVPVALELEAKQIVEVDTLTPASAYGLYGTGGASRNPFMGSAKVVVNPYLTDTTRWYILGTSASGLKALMLQMRRPLEITETDESSALWFAEEKFQVGGSARYAASYTLPQLAITSKP